jgi:hypothetical protein
MNYTPPPPPAEDDEEEDRVVVPTTPHCSMTPEEVADMPVEYSDRHPSDWVLSGPLGPHGGGPGRRFAHIGQAAAHVKALHGDRVLKRIPEATICYRNRWAFLIKGDR